MLRAAAAQVGLALAMYLVTYAAITEVYGYGVGADAAAGGCLVAWAPASSGGGGGAGDGVAMLDVVLFPTALFQPAVLTKLLAMLLYALALFEATKLVSDASCAYVEVLLRRDRADLH